MPLSDLPCLASVRPDVKMDVWYDIGAEHYCAQGQYRAFEGEKPVFVGATADAAIGTCFFYWTGAGRRPHPRWT